MRQGPSARAGDGLRVRTHLWARACVLLVVLAFCALPPGGGEEGSGGSCNPPFRARVRCVPTNPQVSSGCACDGFVDDGWPVDVGTAGFAPDSCTHGLIGSKAARAPLDH
jgi:hypothetical protein